MTRARGTSALLLGVALASCGCRATIPTGRFACAADADCPPGQRCAGARCTVLGADAGRSDAGRSDAAMIDASFDAPACALETLDMAIHGDNQIVMGSCRGANHQGSAPFLNLGIGHGLFRFMLTAEVATAFRDGTVVAARLVLVRDPDCVSGCPASPGSLRTRPMRNDWDEGSDGASTTQVDYAGADWCRRAGGTSPMSWGADGANLPTTDVGLDSGTGMFGMDEPTVTIALDADVIRTDWMNRGMQMLMSIQTVPVSGTLVAAARENAAEGPARLEIDVCRSDEP